MERENRMYKWLCAYLGRSKKPKTLVFKGLQIQNWLSIFFLKWRYNSIMYLIGNTNIPSPCPNILQYWTYLLILSIVEPFFLATHSPQPTLKYS